MRRHRRATVQNRRSITWPPFTENEVRWFKVKFFYQWQPHNPLECGEHQLLAVTVTSPMSALGSPSITTLLPLATAGTPGTDEPKLCILLHVIVHTMGL